MKIDQCLLALPGTKLEDIQTVFSHPQGLLQSRKFMKEHPFNNHALGMVRQWQTLFYGKRYSQTILEDKVDYCKVSEAMGAKAIRVTKKEEIDDAIKTALSAEVPVVIEVVINQDDKVWPMVAPGAAIEDSFDEKDQENRIQN